uniref:Uncharacterized protein n=1 Tax=Siphoviridae sp. ctqpo8 TaxID=2826469 RepID=A0A8S5M320_9CAUD|nr:MAG TPA: hypothetical protein [Siphoviridae sp. ctqpo8]
MRRFLSPRYRRCDAMEKMELTVKASPEFPGMPFLRPHEK